MVKKRKQESHAKHSFVQTYWAHAHLYSIVGAYILVATATILLFGIFYSVLDANGASHLQFNDCSRVIPELRSTNHIYFSSVTFYALGYGDICPAGGSARFISQVEVALGVVINTLFLGFIFWKVLGAHLY